MLIYDNHSKEQCEHDIMSGQMMWLCLQMFEVLLDLNKDLRAMNLPGPLRQLKLIQLNGLKESTQTLFFACDKTIFHLTE